MDQRLCFTAEIVATNLRPDHSLSEADNSMSASLKLIYIIELIGRMQWRRPTSARS